MLRSPMPTYLESKFTILFVILVKLNELNRWTDEQRFKVFSGLG